MHCAGCQAPIIDRYLLNVLDRAWHIRCVQCADCGSALSDKCFSRDGKLFCRSDFFRRFGTKCAGCSQGISPNDLVRKAQNKVFHLKCFTCMVCRKQLSTGEELYIVGENKFLCKEDYLQNKLDGSDVDDDGMDFDSTLDSQDCISDKDLFGDEKPHNGLKSEIKPTDSIKTEVLLNSNHSMNGSNPLHDTFVDSKLGGECPSPIKLEPIHPSDHNIPMKMENGMCDGLPTSPTSPDINMNCSTASGPGSDESVDINDNVSCGDINDNDDQNDQNGNHSGPGSKRRGPRTTIKAKQLEILKAAFNATPKPTRHIREQLASETGLNMRVIQVWFQNRRSKERRMKQLSALGARRHFYRTPRRMRALRGELDDPEMMGPGYGYFNDSEPDMYGNFPPYNNFYPGQTPDMPPGTMNYMMPPSHRGTPPQMEPGMMTSRVGMMPEGHYMSGDILPPSSSPDCIPPHSEDSYLSNGPGRPLGPPFTSSLQTLQNRPEMTSEVW